MGMVNSPRLGERALDGVVLSRRKAVMATTALAAIVLLSTDTLA